MLPSLSFKGACVYLSNLLDDCVKYASEEVVFVTLGFLFRLTQVTCEVFMVVKVVLMGLTGHVVNTSAYFMCMDIPIKPKHVRATTGFCRIGEDILIHLTLTDSRPCCLKGSLLTLSVCIDRVEHLTELRVLILRDSLANCFREF
jgi:hypothetical protein